MLCHAAQGMSIQAIAEARHNQRDTVESYLAECITAGLAYDWQRMAITDAMRDRIKFGLASLFKQHAAQVPPHPQLVSAIAFSLHSDTSR